MSQPPYTPVPQDNGGGLKIPILFGIVIALLAANVYLYMQLDQVKTEVSKTRESLLTEISNLRETSQISSQTSRRHLDSMRQELEAARRRAEAAAGQARTDALKQVGELETRVREESRRQQAEVKAEIGKVEQATQEVGTKVASVATEVGDVKKDVATNKTEIEKTISDLKTARGDLGVQSGLIATNSKELQALRELGERSYFEFNLVKSKQPVRVSDITIRLTKADLKKNRYTLELVADDKRVEKKDKNINEPVQFYMSKYRQPCEIVVNDIKKDRIVGYLSQPKVTASRN